ncbi:MAG: dihydrodipicolinate synthase family protein, partial [Streptomyces sp.]
MPDASGTLRPYTPRTEPAAALAPSGGTRAPLASRTVFAAAHVVA